MHSNSVQTRVLFTPIRVKLDHHVFSHEISVMENWEHLNARSTDVVLDLGQMIANLKLLILSG